MKTFIELYKLDIDKEITLKPTFFKDKQTGTFKETSKDKWLKYLEWSKVIVLLYKSGATSVTYGSYVNNDGYPAFYNNKGKNPFVKVWVKIDEEKYEIDYPVINGNSQTDEPKQLDIHYSQQRAFVKCVAINTGLGLKLWEREESDISDILDNEPSNKEESDKLNEQILKAFNDAIKSGISKEEIYDAVGMNRNGLTKLHQDINALDMKKDVLLKIKSL